MLKVLMVGPSRNANGGMTTVVNNYFESSLKDKVNLKYIATTIDGHIFIRLIYNFIAYIKILSYLLIKRVDIVHIHMASRGSFYRKSLIVKLSKFLCKKVIIHLHGAGFTEFYEDESNDKQKKYINDIFFMADQVVVLSTEWKSKILSWFECNISILENGVFVPNKNQYNPSSKNIVLLGRLNERKGTYDLLNIVNEVVEKFNDVRFILAGDGDLKKLNNKITELEINKYIDVLGWINEEKREEILKNTLIYVLPSYNEGMPMSVIEAMSYGIPTISTWVGGIPQLIDNNESGFLIQPGDIEDLKDKIIILLENNSLRQAMSDKGYKKINERFNLENQISQLISIYNSL